MRATAQTWWYTWQRKRGGGLRICQIPEERKGALLGIRHKRLTCGRVPHASIGSQHEEHVAGYAIIDFEADCIVQLGFTDGRYSPKNSAHEEESWSLRGM